MATGGFADIPTFGSRELKDLRKVIGRGGMGIVALYEWRIDDTRQRISKGQKVAVKRLECTSDLPGVLDEAKILWPLHERCPYILRMFGLMDTNSRISIVLDFMKYGNIAEFFSALSDRVELSSASKDIWCLKRRLTLQVCEGMAYLHGFARPVLHCDLKAANVLLDEGLNAKICDFGLAKIKRLTTKAKSDKLSKEQAVVCPAGTVSHVAPELLRVGNRPTKKADVYSFGILLWELLTSSTPYKEISSPFIIINEVLSERRPELRLLPPDCPPLLKKMMTDAWSQDPEHRPEFAELRRRFNNLDTCGIENSVQFAKQNWELSRETVPKDLATRNTSIGPRVESQSQPFFHTQNYTSHRVAEVPQNQLFEDPRPESILVSDDSNNGSTSNMPSQPESTKHENEDSRVQLLAPRASQAVPTTTNKSVCKIVAIAVTFLIVFCGAAFAVGRFLLPSLKEGCCISCFDTRDPGLESICSPASSQSVAPPGSACKFSCMDGFRLNSNKTELKCEDNGAWSGPLPYCRKIRVCPHLSPPANGGGMKCTSGSREGSTCSFQCPDGYLLRRPNAGTKPAPADFDITCKSDDLSNYGWSEEEPYCEKVVSCQPPASYPVITQCDSPESKYPYGNGTVCKFSCPAETSLSTSETTAICSNDGKWNLTTSLSCIGARCLGTPWKRARMNESIKEIPGISVYGYISQMSGLLGLQSGKPKHFVGEMRNPCSTMKFVCFDEGKYRTMRQYKDNVVAVRLLNVDVRRTAKYGLQVYINNEGVVMKSNRTVPTPPPNNETTTLSSVLEKSLAGDVVNVHVRVISKDPVKWIDDGGESFPLYISRVADETAEMEFNQWGKDRVPLNKTVLITNLKIKQFEGRVILQMQGVSEVRA